LELYEASDITSLFEEDADVGLGSEEGHLATPLF